MSTMSELQEFLTSKVAKQNLEFSTDRDIWKAEAERMTSGYDAAQVELAALREELCGYRAANMVLRDELRTERLRADAAVGDANAAEQRNSELVELLHEWDAMWNGGGIHNGPLTKLRQKTKSALSAAGEAGAQTRKSLQFERDKFEEWADDEAAIRGVGSTIGLSTEEHTDRYSMIWTQTSWIAWQARAALQPTESGASEPQCLLCLDAKTVPGNIPGGFVKDCPDCCGEEG